MEKEERIWVELNDLGLAPGVSFFIRGVKVTKTKKLAGFNIACKWPRKYLGWNPEEGWNIADQSRESIGSYYGLQKKILH